MFKRLIPYYLIAAVVIAIDQASKWVIANNIALYEEHRVLGEFFAITHYRNTGAAFGILKEMRWFFLAITAIVVIGIIWYLHRAVKEGRRLLPAALGLLIGGALGNFYDRSVYGEVVDFLQFRFHFEPFGKPIDYTYPIFNLADSAIFTGVSLILLDSLIAWRREVREAKRASAPNEPTG